MEVTFLEVLILLPRQSAGPAPGEGFAEGEVAQSLEKVPERLKHVTHISAVMLHCDTRQPSGGGGDRLLKRPKSRCHACAWSSVVSGGLR